MKVKLKNVGIIENCDVEFIPGINLIIGSSGSGKSTLMRCIYNMAANEFSDADISFGKNTMSIEIDNGNVVKYSRSIKARGDKCSYDINGEHYVKLGRQPLSVVTDVLKIGAIDICGDSVNFNFNLQFSSPFLILGNQSTLYNVLTYRNTCDITSINDYYATDVRNNAAEIITANKVKEQLDSNLTSLNNQADSLSSIESVYSNYITCKHNASIIDDLCRFNNLKKSYDETLSKLNSVKKLINDIEYSNNCINDAVNITKLKDISSQAVLIKEKLSWYNNFNDLYNNVVTRSQILSELTKFLNNRNNLLEIKTLYNNLSSNVDKCESLLKNELFANDITKLNKLLHYADVNNKIISVLGGSDSEQSLDTLSNVISVYDNIVSRDNTISKIKDIDMYINNISNELSTFKVCPLCGAHT